MKIRAALAVLAITLLASCAYYNGLYNAKDLARRAEKSEREGRPFDAQNYWGQAAVKAETVLARHPRSKWAEEARWLDGKALERSGNCRAAMTPLQRTLREAQDPRRADDAALRLAACQVQMGDVDAAGLSVERLLQSPDPAIRSEAAWRAGSTYRRTGRSSEAVVVLRSSGHPRARGELPAALADVGEVPAAIALADSLLTEGDTLAPWGAIITSIGRRDVVQGSALLDRVIAALHLMPDSMTVWLAADAARWLPVDTGRAYARYAAAHDAAPNTPAGLQALLTSFLRRLASTADPAILDSITDQLGDIPASTGASLVQARSMVEVATRSRARLDSISAAAPQGDLRGFLLGEALRDSMHAPRLAALVWRRVVTERSASPYAPKVWLALAAVGGAPNDSVLTLLADRYSDSPYVHVLHGTGDDGYRSLEDSLARFARSQRTPTRTTRPTVRGSRPANAPLPAAPLP